MRDSTVAESLFFNSESSHVFHRLYAYGYSTFFGTSPPSESLSTILWSPAPINWCENDYDYYPHIAEFWNTLSNLSFILSGIYCLYQAKKYRLNKYYYYQAIFLILTGIFSGLFHATLTWFGQKLDEFAETATCIYIFYCRYSQESYGSIIAAIHTGIAAIGIFIVAGFLFCEIHLLIISFSLAYRLRTDSVTGNHNSYTLVAKKKENNNNNNNNNAKDQSVIDIKEPSTQSAFQSHLSRIRYHSFFAIGYAVFGFSCWLIDRLDCNNIGQLLPFHAAWHIIMGAALHNAIQCTVCLYSLSPFIPMKNNTPFTFTPIMKWGLTWAIPSYQWEKLQENNNNNNQKKKAN